MKKFITYIRRFIIVFTLVAYVFPIFCFPAVTIYHFLNAKETVSAKGNDQKSSISLLGENTKESLNKDSIENFADHMFNEQLKKFNVPGAVFTVVKDNKVIFEKGYGYSDLDKKIPVDPKTTVFRAASVSKTFTATAVMQLKEKNKLNLNKDVNKYLKDFKIDNKYSKPVTLNNLLTHTAGFDEKFIKESQIESYLQEKPLKDDLISRPRPIIREPGEIPQYSNYGMSVAGYAVESITGVPFNKYIEDNILKPLNMTNSTFSWNKKILNNLSQGYDYKNGVNKKIPIYGEVLSPAGGLKTTGDDMAKFMIAHLNHGTYDNTSILNKDTIDDMDKKHFPLDKNIPGVCYGLTENYINGVKVLSQGGNNYGFNSVLNLIPEDNLGFFISTNGNSGASVCSSISMQFINKYYPQTKPQITKNIDSNFTKSNLKKLEGTYQSIRYPKNELGKLILLFTPTLQIGNNSDTLILKYPGGEDIYKEIEPLIFKNVKKGDTLTFKTNGQENTSYLLTAGSSTAFEKVKWYENPTLHKIIFMIFSVLFLFMSIIMILLKFKKKIVEEPIRFKYCRWIIFSISILNLIFLLGMAKEGIALFSTLPFVPDLLPAIKRLLIIPIVTTIFSLGLLILTCVHWNKEKTDFSKNVCIIVICCVFLIFSVFLNYWNLLGFKF
ncbi:serine hydrolase domain-containing protein [Clostridium scatologenes]|uniref:Penicillin-binding protein n=1 Tax=Clostridium scatologenes TaxID=1548 RepID=A0A0E3M8C1_CLOSL|nr:serine hydrolase domain-containing protein [Clostridium scatologenes]AKA68153.1 penicillin-binding protein [Clostridium scatologenes]